MTQKNENLDNNKTVSQEENSIDDKAQNDDNKSSVPLNTFLEQKKANKELKEKLATYQKAEEALAQKKLLEEEKFEELIQLKSREAEDYKKQLDNERTNNKLEKIKNRFSNELLKQNVIDADDALRLVEYNDLLGSDSFDSEIKSRVADLTKNKSYLFKDSKTTRSDSENNTPAAGQPQNPGSNAKIDSTLASLIKKFS